MTETVTHRFSGDPILGDPEVEMIVTTDTDGDIVKTELVLVEPKQFQQTYADFYGAW